MSQQDWFEQNAPKQTASPDAGDWFAANAPADIPTQQAAPQSAVGQLFDSSKPLADRFRTADIALSGLGVNLAKGAIKKMAEPAATIAGGLNKLPWLGELLAPSQGVSAFKQAVQPSNTAQTVGGIGEQAGEMAVTGAPLRAGAEAIAAKLPFLAKYFAPVARIGAEALNTGMSAAAHGQPVGTSAGIGAAGGAVGEAFDALAPTLDNKALGIAGKDTRYGQTPAQAILDNTSGIRPATIARQAGQRASSLTRQMESGIADATQRTASGQAGMISTDSAHQVLDNALANAPRNATTYKDKISSLRDLLSFDAPGTVGPARRDFTPDEILEMKRGINKEISSWDSTARKSVTPVTKQLYRALDSQLDAAAPGNAELNQQIGSLITGSKRAEATAGRRSGVVTQLLSRGVPATAGGALGYSQGGPKGAAVGAAGGALLATPAGQMALARLLNAGLPEILARGLVSSGFGQEVQGSR
jgi:hypothetical protein